MYWCITNHIKPADDTVVDIMKAITQALSRHYSYNNLTGMTPAMQFKLKSIQICLTQITIYKQKPSVNSCISVPTLFFFCAKPPDCVAKSLRRRAVNPIDKMPWGFESHQCHLIPWGFESHQCHSSEEDFVPLHPVFESPQSPELFWCLALNKAEKKNKDWVFITLVMPLICIQML